MAEQGDKADNQNNLDKGDKVDKPQNITDPSDIKKKRRRKVEDGDRKFPCKICHKAYLSYPALYTHTKTKHEKVPSRINAEALPKNTKPQDPQEFYEQLIQMLGPSPTPLIELDTVEGVLEPFGQEKEELSEAIAFWRSGPQERMNDQTKLFKTTIDQIFVKVLFKLLNRINLFRLRQLCVVLLIWRKCINSEWRNYPLPGSYSVYTKEASGENLMRSVNDLVIRYFSEHSEEYLRGVEEVTLLQGMAEKVNLCNLVVVLSKLFHASNYTHQRIRYNEYEQ